MKFKIIFLSLLFVIAFIPLKASNHADSLAKEAISLMNRQKFEDATALLQKAMQIDSSSIVYPYEYALCHYKMENYEKTISILEPLKDHPDNFEQIFQIIGNSYDFLAKKTKAIETYIEGLEKYPNSGRLHMELGIAEMGRDNFNLAVSYFQKGIIVDPSYPNNYYRLAKYYSENEYNIFALFYTEYFLNYTKNQSKFREMNKEIGKLFNKSLKWEGNKYSFKYKKGEINRLTKEYFSVLSDAVNTLFPEKKDKLSISDISKIRTKFLSKWFENNKNKKYYLGLFEYQKLLKEKDLFESYNYWLMSDYDLNEFKSWFAQNHAKYDALLKWLKENDLSTENLIKYFK